MSKRNRERRLWRCQKPGCGARLDPVAGRAAEAEHPRAAARGVDLAPVVHVCGECRTFHRLDAGRVRLLTPAERFTLEVDCPKACRLVESGAAHSADQSTILITHAER